MTGVAIVCLALIAYSYVGYGFLLWLMTKLRPAQEFPSHREWPPVDVIIAAYNEEAHLARTIQSILNSDYPADRRRVIVVSDASTDGTDAFLASCDPSVVRWVRQSERQGKLNAQKTGLALAQAEIVVFSDANSVFEPPALRNLLRPFADPKVGAATGSKRTQRAGASAAQGESVYWRYEAILRSLESRTGSSWVGCEGGLYAMRRTLLDFNFPGDWAMDYCVCCRLFEQGYQNRYVPEARVLETVLDELPDEFSRKIRVIVRGIRGFFGFGYLLNPFVHPVFSFQNLSHRLTRWMVPFALLGLWISSLLSKAPAMHILFGIQTVLYLFALLGIFIRHRWKIPSILAVPAYFTVVNAAGFIAWFLIFRRYGIWQPSVRRRELSAT